MTQDEYRHMKERLDNAAKVKGEIDQLADAMRDLRTGAWPYDVLRKLVGVPDSVTTTDEVNPLIEAALATLYQRRVKELESL